MLERLSDLASPDDLRAGPGSWGEPEAMIGVAIVIPMLNEAAGLPRLLRSLATLEPPPAEVLVVDGGSTDASVAIAEAAGLLVVRHDARGRAAAINHGVQEATASIICVLHADTLLPDDAVAVMRRVLADPGTALAGFTPLLSGPDQVRWGTSFHNWIVLLRAVAVGHHRSKASTVGGRHIDHNSLTHGPDSHAPCEPGILKGTHSSDWMH